MPSKVVLHTKAHGHLTLDDVESLEIDGILFVSAAAIPKLFQQPDRIVRLSLQGEHNMPIVEIILPSVKDGLSVTRDYLNSDMENDYAAKEA